MVGVREYNQGSGKEVPHDLTPQERLRRARMDYRRGVRVADIAKTWGVSTQTLYKGLKRKRGGRCDALRKEEKSRIVELNYQGFSDCRIASRIGRAQTTVSKYRRALGLPVVPRNQRKR